MKNSDLIRRSVGILTKNNLPTKEQGKDNGIYYLIIYILVTLALSERNIKYDDLPYWNISKNLNKHRSSKEYDNHIQKMLLFLNPIGDFVCCEYRCSSNNYYRTKIENKKDGSVLFVMHSPNMKSNYLEEYLKMNEDILNPKFYYIKYGFDNKSEQIDSVYFVLPNSKGHSEKEISFTDDYNKIREQIKLVRDKVNFIYYLKASTSKIPDNLKQK